MTGKMKGKKIEKKAGKINKTRMLYISGDMEGKHGYAEGGPDGLGDELSV